MAPTGKKVRRSGIKNRGKENTTGRKLTRGKPTKRRAKTVERRTKRRRANYNLRSSSVEFVSETPYCENEDTRKKYASLGLDTALFHSKIRPARRKQSHISVVTISSSDDDESMARTAEWVSSVAIEKEDILSPEEGINTDQSHRKNRGGGETEEISHQLSLLQFPTSEGEGSRFGSSTSFTSAPGINPTPTSSPAVVTESFGTSASEKYQTLEVKRPVRSSLFSVRSSEKQQSPTFLSHAECLPSSSNIAEQNRLSRFDPILPSIQECRSFPSRTVVIQQASTSEVRRSFCFVNSDKNRANQNSDARRPFYTITPESQSVLTSSGFEEKRPLYTSTHVKHHNSPVEEQSLFCFMPPTKEQMPQECKPLFSSTTGSHENNSQSGIGKRNIFCNTTIEVKQDSKLLNPQGNRSFFFSSPNPTEVQHSPEFVLGSTSTTTQSSIFTNPQQRSNTTVYLRKSHTFSTPDSSMQVDEDELEHGKQKQFYFGSIKTQDPSEQLTLSNVEENELTQENNSTSSQEFSLSGIEQISDGNAESPQESMIQEADTENL